MANPFFSPSTLPYAGKLTIPITQAPYTLSQPDTLGWSTSCCWPASMGADGTGKAPNSSITRYRVHWYTPFNHAVTTSDVSYDPDANDYRFCNVWPTSFAVMSNFNPVDINGVIPGSMGGIFHNPLATINNSGAIPLNKNKKYLNAEFPGTPNGIGDNLPLLPINVDIGFGFTTIGWASDLWNSVSNPDTNPSGATAFMPYGPSLLFAPYQLWKYAQCDPASPGSFNFGANFRWVNSIPYGNRNMMFGANANDAGNYLALRTYKAGGRLSMNQAINFSLEDPIYNGVVFSSLSSTVVGLIIHTKIAPTNDVVNPVGGSYYFIIPPTMDKYYCIQLVGGSGLANQFLSGLGASSVRLNIKIDNAGVLYFADNSFTNVYTSFASHITIPVPVPQPVVFSCVGGCNGVPLQFGLL